MISAIIPTYRQSATLLQALASLQAQTCTHYEVIVVNNAADSDIDRVVREVAISSRAPLRCVPSPPGVLHEARHAGARAAAGQILVFTDDDATFDPGWLQAYSDAFEAHPEMAAAGGPVRPVWTVSPPQWLIDYLGDINNTIILSLMEPHKEFCLGVKEGFFGVNMAIRRSALYEMGGFRPEAFGDTWFGNGESGLNFKLWEAGKLVGYVPGAIVYHHIPARRMTVDYLCRRSANEGASEAYTEFHQGIPGMPRLCTRAVGLAIRNSKTWLLARFLKGRTDPESLHIQLQAANTYSQLKYVGRLIFDKNFQKLVLKSDWLERSAVNDMGHVPAQLG